MLDLETVFAPLGPLERGLSDYRPRQAQKEMALAVGQALQERSALIVEAGTGTGKTFAYLVPALLSGARVVLSTGTKTLQDQLFLRDIPALRSLLKIPVTVALLKGRANYLCHHHLDLTLRQGSLFDRQEVSHLEEIRAFAERTATGDIAELGEVPESATIWHKVTSTRENCLGQECDHHADCFVLKARKQALQADLVVVNHHLFFADLALKDEGSGELLPRADAVIFDEAHQLPQIASNFFGDNLSTASVVETVESVQSLLTAASLSQQDFTAHSQPLLKSVKALRHCFGPDAGRWTHARAQRREGFPESWKIFVEHLGNWISWLEAQSASSEDIATVVANLQQGWEVVQRWQEDEVSGQVRWLETFSQTLHINATPLLLGDCLGPIWKDGGRSWIFTSATLSVRGDFSHYRENLGLPEAQCHSWESPFDFGHQALLFVPDSLPLPAAPDHTLRLLEQAQSLLQASQGRAFLLFTSHRALQEAARILETWSKEGRWIFPLLVQGQRARGDLLNRFRQMKDPVLLGTASFWEGVDIKGEALSVVIIDKLPFAPPDDPVEAARIEEIKRSGRNGFMDYQVPRAILQLKQGAGRLIRDEQDRGVLMIGDRRILEKPYGQQIWQSLPPMKRTRDLSVACRFFSEPENH